jgi:hypothetical protein
MKRFSAFLLTFLFILITFVEVSTKVQAAGQDLSLVCNTSSCTVLPAGQPFFSELNLVPGNSITRKINARNNTAQNGTLSFRGFDLEEATQSASLAEKIVVVVRRGAVNGPVVYGGTPKTLKNLIDEGPISLGSFLSNQTIPYFFSAAVKQDADNQYQNLATVFDFDIGFDFVPNPPSGPSGSTNGGGGGGGTSAASAPTCGDTAPSSAPVLSFTESSTADGQVTLQWTAIGGVSNYAVNFGIQPGVYLYGNNNIGNQTSYTVTGLTPGNQYFFQVLGVNGCAPGPRSNEISTIGNAVGLGANVNAPAGFSTDQVLGEATGEAKPASESEGNSGDILGAQACTPWRPFLPIIFLVVQIILSIVVYAVYRRPDNKMKQIGVVVAVVVTNLLFYYLRNCDCSNITILSLLCQWYIVVSIATALVTQFINYALIEREK